MKLDNEQFSYKLNEPMQLFINYSKAKLIRTKSNLGQAEKLLNDVRGTAINSIHSI